MKALYIAIAAVLIIGIVGYFGRNQLKSLYGKPTPAPTVSTVANLQPSVAPAATTSAGIVNTKTASVKGAYLVSSTGMTLYIFDKDKPGVSNCSGSCAKLWPPYTTTSTPATLPANVTTIKRADGSMQFAYKNMPVYYYTPDKQPGDITGDGVGGIWHLVQP